MRAAAYREMTPEELRKKLDDALRELFSLRVKVSQQRNTGRIRELRRDVARLKTVLRAKGMRA
ncbi:MAG: 50S ribosomal protein L29 [Armatimonadota bacterium]|nr:50S ribosomal protein L29 [Armatimonadota bacterium]MDR7427934.1 50S ribosomal protein L29 [Armatimonadota bacterium]MDR7465261.1 50S ribosomal protein L29 [Armatimonadota bacterium]MDR7470408.1 50S ribosomal protein L29 [Armatimonadota bacterium]MDR7473490.1 50S ribosomal protein L29 [Armatimonadota bacterium]